MRSHAGAKPYACEICGKDFAKLNHLKKHMQTHTGGKPHAWEICENYFARAEYLKRHGHTKERTYACEICGKDLVRTGDLKTHTRIHTGEKSFGEAHANAYWGKTSCL
uniref:protein krueppel-like n=1 Tax=Styela clava TaxID=7725 RepID=UPI00193A84AF|nr:protein krueppel-like [Styela clava]